MADPRRERTTSVIPLPIQSLLLFVTLMFGPAGFLTYWLIRIARSRGSDLGGDAARLLR